MPRSPTEGSALQLASWSTALAKERPPLQEDAGAGPARQRQAQPTPTVGKISDAYLGLGVTCISGSVPKPGDQSVSHGVRHVGRGCYPSRSSHVLSPGTFLKHMWQPPLASLVAPRHECYYDPI